MRKFASASGRDKAFGLRDNDGRFYIGNKEAKIKENNIIVGDRNTLARLDYGSHMGVATTSGDKIFTNGIMIIMLKLCIQQMP